MSVLMGFGCLSAALRGLIQSAAIAVWILSEAVFAPAVCITNVSQCCYPFHKPNTEQITLSLDPSVRSPEGSSCQKAYLPRANSLGRESHLSPGHGIPGTYPFQLPHTSPAGSARAELTAPCNRQLRIRKGWKRQQPF